MAYRALKQLRWGGDDLSPGELLSHIPGRRYETMVENGLIEIVTEPAKEPVTHVVEAPKKPRGRPLKVRTEENN